MHKKHVSAVIPTYNGLTLLKKNLPAVFKALNDQDEVVIVDDASDDQTIAWVAEKFTTKNWKMKTKSGIVKVKIGKQSLDGKEIRVVVVKNHKNLRFAKSCNKGVEVAKYDYILLLNNDVSPHANFLLPLLAHFDDPQVFGVGCKEIEKNQGHITSGKNTLQFKRGMFIHSRAKDFDFGPTAWVSGGSGVFDRQKWSELNGFDPDFAPAYWEDIDLSYRARKRGWLVLFEPKAVVDHNHESTNINVFGSQQMYQMSWKNANLFTHKHANFGQKIIYQLFKPYWKWKLRKIGQ